MQGTTQVSAERPDPDFLLSRVQHEESRAHRGKLRIFFGYAAGVGKTYTMLQAAQRERAAGTDVVVGYVEPHGRDETEALLQGLETLPVRSIAYRGVTLHEFDLDAALARRPKLLLVDELAHTNAEGTRHAKRWQDVVELLDAGIDVWTTLNVQHLESLNDVISQITGIAVRETLPDAVLEQADEIELVDVTPEELLSRFKAGKVYVLRQIDLALQGFFQRGNLVALRELSLRQTADRLQRDVDAARKERNAPAPWLTAERLLVCVGPSPSSARILRSAKRLAASLGAEWLAVAVNTGVDAAADAAWAQTGQNLRLAERLGAETHTLTGRGVAQTLLDFARERNVSKIVVGKTAQSWWKRRLWGTIVDDLLRDAGDVDVYAVSGEAEESSRPAPAKPAAPVAWRDYAFAAAMVACAALLGWAARSLHLAEANIVMIFLAAVAVVATRWGRGPAIAAAVASVLVFDFCFVTPYLTFAVSDTEYAITFLVMLGIGLLISSLASRQRSQLRAAQQQEKRTGQLFRMTRQLSELSGSEFLVRTAGRQLEDIFGGEAVVFMRLADGSTALRFGETSSIAKHLINRDVARWVVDHESTAGAGTDTLPNATALFVPMIGSRGVVGAVGVRPQDISRFVDPEQQRLLETCASLIALSLERDESVLAAHEAQLDAESEKLRSSLLAAVSHDIRTPLAGIAGASSTLARAETSLSPAARADMLRTITEESERLSRLVDNLLQMTRLSSGKVVIDRQWHPLDEIIGSTLTRMERLLSDRPIEARVDEGTPMAYVDAVLMEQLLANLVENAAKFSPPGSPIEVSARRDAEGYLVEVADRGQGFAPGDEQRVFELYYRGGQRPDRRGTGIGLAICRSIAEAHGGRISAHNRPEGGAVVRLRLPHAGSAPEQPSEP